MKACGEQFWQQVRDLHAAGVTPSEAARLLGYVERNPKNGVRCFFSLLNRHPDRDPWGARSVAAQYTRRTGESFGDAIRRLAKTCTASQAARELGFAGTAPLRYALNARGIVVEFRQASIPDATIEQYLRMRLDRIPGKTAAQVLGHSQCALHRAARRRFPGVAALLPRPLYNRRETQ